ncbi:MAG TPA: GEVED domain-containing protein [Chitinophagaceae bacterium]|mgnify:CR=1 FL=1|nr:GEVED domain-containing protein [Chitinophagaceae bacterium]HPH30879.1 GEVED domain-containing protein [Chitinophagaceae bacterium]HPN57560.1 GEVED domain-containing protein [Chitinophagaceae bacterium]
MKKLYHRLLAAAFICSSFTSQVSAQCTNANVNWDNLEYFITNGNTNYTTFINTPTLFANLVQSQRFAIGTNAVTISSNYPANGILGDNTSHTGETGSFGSGADINFTGNGTITLTFDTAVSNVQFSIFDLDLSQNVTVTAFEGVTPRVPVLTKPVGGTVTIVGNIGTGPAGGIASSSSNATLNVAVAGPVTSITLVFAGTAGDFWISDIQACVYRNFATNYYVIAQPFTGQPSYVMVVHDLNTVFYVNPANGRAVSIFTDPDPRVREINNIAYDPYKRIIYYSVDGLERCTPAGSPDSIRHIKKYDMNTETISTLISDVKTAPFNIPTFHAGLESGGAAFYDADLYVGVEGYKLSGTKNSGRETVIWRIEFASDSITPSKACQVWGTPVDNGSNNIHDYADFGLKDGVIYDFNSSTAVGSGRGQYWQINMQSNTTTSTVVPNILANRPAQTAQSWNGTIYWVADSIGVFNGTVANTVTGKSRILSSPQSVTWVGPAGDAGEAFRPKADFGDAPSTYDPVALSPALHEKDTALFLGNVFTNDWDWEWDKQTSSDASGDGVDDNDGLTYVSVFDKTTGNYLVQANIYNNTGADATLIAWFDYNGNGVYDASEALAPITIASSPVVQQHYLHWSGISSTIANGTYTYLRLRLTSSSNSMTTSNPTGYFNNGEVEDYRVLVDNFPLSVNLLSFDAKATGRRTAKLSWKTINESELSGFGIERSADGVNWTNIGFADAKGNNNTGSNTYEFIDQQALKGQSYYRLKLTDINPVTSRFSETRAIRIEDVVQNLTLVPNPAQASTSMHLSSTANIAATIKVMDMTGRAMQTIKTALNPGENVIQLNGLEKYPKGTYLIQVVAEDLVINRKLVITK